MMANVKPISCEVFSFALRFNDAKAILLALPPTLAPILRLTLIITLATKTMITVSTAPADTTIAVSLMFWL